jgi:hypothetical protein
LIIVCLGFFSFSPFFSSFWATTPMVLFFLPFLELELLLP